MSTATFCEIDPAMPYLGDALDPISATPHLAAALSMHWRTTVRVKIDQAQLIRHKIGRRCLIAYDLQIAME
jgi:hypothetical protein